MNNAKENNFELREEVRFLYSRVINFYMQSYLDYKNFKKQFNSVEVDKYYYLLDKFYLDNTGNLNWVRIKKMMPPKLEQNIKKTYNTLNEKEVMLCCLLLFDVTVINIANALSYKTRSIHTITHKIKQKTGMKDLRSDLSSLLLQSDDL